MKIFEMKKREWLIDRMDEAGCVFEFVVFKLEPGIVVNEFVHRQALVGLHEQLMKAAWDCHSNLIKDPRYESNAGPEISWKLEKAVATPLSDDELNNLMLVEGYVRGPLALYGHFREPPYGTQFKGGEPEAQELFHEWRNAIGLVENNGVSAINWVKGINTTWIDCEDAISGRESWSNYFDSGLEWWGIWCMTIWNPERRTISALIASTTD
ncbi:hypothetical protein [Pseudomonas protegens]